MLEVLSVVVVRGMLRFSTDLFFTRRKGKKITNRSSKWLLKRNWMELVLCLNISLENPRNILRVKVYSIFEKEHERVNVHRC
jgi:hypothetical protein